MLFKIRSSRNSLHLPLGWFFSVLSVLVVATAAQAALELPSLFTDHMVLQRDQPNKVWGWDEPGTEVTVSFGGKSYSAQAGEDGKWSLFLDSSPVNSEPEVLAVEGTSTVEVLDVLVGEVWICSGQSNMQWPLQKDWTGDLNGLAANLTGLRLISVPQVGTQELQDNFVGEWSVSSPETAADFSAVGFYFGRYLHQILGVPVGLIDNAWGGSNADAWVRRDLLENDPRFTAAMELTRGNEEWMQAADAWEQYERRLETWKQNQAAGGNWMPKPREPWRWLSGQHRAGNLYAGVLYPTIGYGIKGVIWYQGEGNSGRSHEYRELFPFMIKHWRSEWGQGDFPFYWVQLADFKNEQEMPGESGWAELRAAQTSTLSLPNTGQAVIIDIGEGNDIHPRNKYDVASRLARWALVKDYGFKLPYRSPEYAGMTVEGATVTIKFNTFGSALKLYDLNELKGFAICGEDRVWHWADARLTGKDTVEVSSEAVPEPVAVRYAWADNPVCNLISTDGLPVTPFRTDDFPWITDRSQ
ncbi:sialate O-acetylesterase [Puniceicoccales bacterium CK1056]|uniref:Sialate O-acetylesterase n=1 Tax=Oceanipulchritudo coccoides TaxID=2706888 RepID=A0A6B2LZR5_9BACT|nr:sialate O-acetylesterase [Oceanipulchritudo coccoides]NDV61267.1 sialate O-acetylesterase [Oceanipulchritudo coccoides]